MLDHVERRRFLVNPTGKDATPAVVRLPDIELQEGACQRLFFPRRARLAGTKPNDGIFDPDRLTRPQSQVADDAVALVEQADNGNPFGHRRGSRLSGAGHGHVDRDRLAFFGLIRTVARGKQCHAEKSD